MKKTKDIISVIEKITSILNQCKEIFDRNYKLPNYDMLVYESELIFCVKCKLI